MKKLTIGIATFALVFGIAFISANSAFAYRGNTSVKGPNYSTDRHAVMLKIFESNDYIAWKKLQNQSHITSIITESNFPKFAQAHILASQGKTVEAQKIYQELGLTNGSSYGMGGMMHRGMGMGKGLNW